MSEYLKQPKNAYTQPKSKSYNSEKTRAAQLKELEYNLQKKPLQKFAKEEESASANALADKEEVQTKEDNTQLKEPASAKASAGNKTNMPEDVKSKMENSFGTDFSDVSIHKNSDNATNIGALAYTQGNDVHFAPGQYEPGSQKGQELLGHELTHVVQQREGRVKPDTEQHKGLNINSDTTLEKEADEMGTKAAQGKMANVRGSSNGVQTKGNDNIDLKSKIPTTFEGLDVIGYEIGEYRNKGLLDDGYSIRLLLSGKSENWKNILKDYSNRYHSFNDYVLPFLAESNGSYWGIRDKNPDNNKFIKWESEKSREVDENDKLEFLKALYDTDDKTNSSVNLTDKFWEADANVMSFVNRQWEGLANFIKFNQHLIIEYMAGKGQYFDRSDIANLAEQGHTGGQAIADLPYVINAMIQNAVATAINSVKNIIFASENESDLYKTTKKYIDMVKNAALIASSTIDQYGKSIKSISSGAGKVFDVLWRTIPFGGTIASIAGDNVKDLLKKGFGQILEVGGDYAKPEELKAKLADQFDLETNKLNNPDLTDIYIDPFQLTTIQNAFRVFINEKTN